MRPRQTVSLEGNRQRQEVKSAEPHKESDWQNKTGNDLTDADTGSTLRTDFTHFKDQNSKLNDFYHFYTFNSCLHFVHLFHTLTSWFHSKYERKCCYKQRLHLASYSLLGKKRSYLQKWIFILRFYHKVGRNKVTRRCSRGWWRAAIFWKWHKWPMITMVMIYLKCSLKSAQPVYMGVSAVWWWRGSRVERRRGGRSGESNCCRGDVIKDS